MINYILLCIFAYFLGSINFARVFASLAHKQIPEGKNPGTATVFYGISKPIGILTGVFDVLKGSFPIFLARFYLLDPRFSSLFYLLLLGFFAILGHIYPIYYKFKGGRGAATTIGVALAISPIQVLLACIPIYFLCLIFKKSLGWFASVCLPIVLIIIFFTKDILSFYEYLKGILLIVLLLIIRNFDQIKDKIINNK